MSPAPPIGSLTPQPAGAGSIQPTFNFSSFKPTGVTSDPPPSLFQSKPMVDSNALKMATSGFSPVEQVKVNPGVQQKVKQAQPEPKIAIQPERIKKSSSELIKIATQEVGSFEEELKGFVAKNKSFQPEVSYLIFLPLKSNTLIHHSDFV